MGEPGRVAMVTGASRGIGRAIAVMLAGEGHRVALVGRDRRALRETRRACEAAGAEAVELVADLTVPDEVDALVDRTRERLGDLAVLVHNAGVASYAPIDAARWEDAARVLDTNLGAAVRLTLRAVGPIRAARGAIVFVSSVSGKLGFAGLSSYAASKHGLVGFSASVFEDLRAHGVKVSCICPGTVNSEMQKNLGAAARRVLQPEDVAEAVRFVLRFPSTGCPTEILLRSTFPPYP